MLPAAGTDTAQVAGLAAEIAGLADPEGQALLRDVAAYVDAHRAADLVATGLGAAPDPAFDALALRVFAWQYRRIPVYRRFCDGRGADPETTRHWSRAPMVPITSFRSQVFAAAPSRAVFRSSGTTGGPDARSVHHHAFPALYRRVIEKLFAPFCLPPGAPERRRLLALVPSAAQMPDSSLSFMVDHLIARHGDERAVVAFGDRGADPAAADAACAAAIALGEPLTIFATAFALAAWLEASPERRVLPEGSTLMETGGFKGRHRELERAELSRMVEERLGLPSSRLIREYGMTELTSHCYTRALAGGDPDLFVPPPWLRVRALDPATLEEAPPGKLGLLAFFDLANLGSAAHLLSQDLGRAEKSGAFRLEGRARGAALRGCSLTAEELQRAAW